MSLRPVDDLVYGHPDGITYVALFEDHGWQRWPAQEQGWARRQGCSASLADACEELAPRLAHLALQLSGAVPVTRPARVPIDWSPLPGSDP